MNKLKEKKCIVYKGQFYEQALPEELKLGGAFWIIKDGLRNLYIVTEPVHITMDEATSPATVGTEFDPTKETIDKGKYVGMKWSELPDGYLMWAAQQPGDLANKATATMVYKQRAKAAAALQPEPGHQMTLGEDGAQ